jgi:hypothetical protein
LNRLSPEDDTSLGAEGSGAVPSGDRPILACPAGPSFRHMECQECGPGYFTQFCEGEKWWGELIGSPAIILGERH